MMMIKLQVQLKPEPEAAVPVTVFKFKHRDSSNPQLLLVVAKYILVVVGLELPPSQLET
jgi:hypothetical protein